jgi:hypothetical protein
MNKIAIFSDLHLGLKQDDERWHRIALCWCDSFVDELKRNGIEEIVFLGDFFHTRNSISVNTLHVANIFLEKLKDFKIHMILGNHDLYFHNESTVSGVNLFKNKNNIIVYDRPVKTKLGSKDAVFCGWGYDALEYNADILFTHAEINVFKFNADLGACNSGYKASDLLNHYNLVYSGHFHLRQNKSWENKHIIYPGNPYPMDHSDYYGSIKGFDILDLDTLESIVVENIVSPQFLRLSLSDICSDYYTIPEIISQIRGNIFKLIVDKNITHKDLNILTNLINGVNPFEFSYEWAIGTEANEEGVSTNLEYLDFGDLIRDYIKLLDLDNKNKIEEYILNLYKKVKDVN